MPSHRPAPRWIWLLAVGLAGLAGSAGLARLEWQQQRDAFETSGRIAHRLLSQRAVQLEAVLATLTLLQPAAAAGSLDAPEQRLPALYPQVLQVLRRAPGDTWPPALAAAEAESAASQRAALAQPDLANGRYTLVLAGRPASYALRIDAAALLPWEEWPLPRSGPVRVQLQHAGQRFVLQPGDGAGGPVAGMDTPSTPSTASTAPTHTARRFEFDKPLASPSQPFHLQLSRSWPWSAWPWGRIALWWLVVAGTAAALAALLRQREGRRRAEELLRLGRVGRLNAMGELAAGMAHELNQPLTAVLASTQAAQRLLADDEPELQTVQRALAQSVQQARRASEVVGRLRRLVQPAQADAVPQLLRLADTVTQVLYLLAPDIERLAVQTELRGELGLWVLADPVALEQIVHNLVQNALQALAQRPPLPARPHRLLLQIEAAEARSVRLRLHDSGPGFSAESLARAFEPFFTTRPGGSDAGLGLGLSLCETLATGMGGSLAAANHPQGGAELTLLLPRAAAGPLASPAQATA